MEVVGGVSAILQIAQTGIQLATTLNAYIGDFKDGQADIASLANEIDSTVIHLEEVDRRIRDNDFTHGWSEGGLKLAKKCCSDCERVIKKLCKLLKKSGAGHEINDKAGSGETIVKREDIDLSIFRKSAWPIHKPRFLAAKQELVNIKLDILICLQTYTAHVGKTTFEKKAAAEKIVSLWKAKTEARRKLQEARSSAIAVRPQSENPYRSNMYEPTSPGGAYFPATNNFPPPPEKYEEEYVRPRRRYGRSRSSSRDSSVRNSRYNQNRGEKAGIGRERSLSTSSSTSSETIRRRRRKARFRSPSRSPSVVRVDPRSNAREKGDEMAVVGVTGSEAELPGSESMMTGILRAISHVKKPRFGTSINPSLLAQAMQAHPEETKTLLTFFNSQGNTFSKPKVGGLPSILQDPTLQSGVAYTRAISLLKVNDTHFRPYEVQYPFNVLSKRLLQEEKNVKSDSPFELQAWKNFLDLPLPCRQYIQEFLDRGKSSEDGYFWTLLVADPIYRDAPRGRSLFRRKPKPVEADIASVLLVFRRSEQQKLQRTNGLREDIIDAIVSRIDDRDKRKIGNVARQIAKAAKNRRERMNSFRSLSRSRTRARRRERSVSRSRSPRRRYSYPYTDANPYGATSAGAAGYSRKASTRAAADLVEYGDDPLYTSVDSNAPDNELRRQIMVTWTGDSGSADKEKDGKDDASVRSVHTIEEMEEGRAGQRMASPPGGSSDGIRVKGSDAVDTSNENGQNGDSAPAQHPGGAFGTAYQPAHPAPYNPADYPPPPTA